MYLPVQQSIHQNLEYIFAFYKLCKITHGFQPQGPTFTELQHVIVNLERAKPALFALHWTPAQMLLAG